jgi:hypothetical protein
MVQLTTNLKKTGKAVRPNGKPVPGGEVTDVFIALLEAERWLFAAGEGLTGGRDPETAKAIEAIRRKLSEQLEKLQTRAYAGFDGKRRAG